MSARRTEGAVVLAEASHGRQVPGADDQTHSVTVRVEDARSHFEHARDAAAVTTSEPTDMEFASDAGRHSWAAGQWVALPGQTTGSHEPTSPTDLPPRQRPGSR